MHSEVKHIAHSIIKQHITGVSADWYHRNPVPNFESLRFHNGGLKQTSSLFMVRRPRDVNSRKDGNDGDGDNYNGIWKQKQIGALGQTSVLLSRAPDAGKRKQLPIINPPRNRTTGITRNRNPDTRKNISKKALPRHTGGSQQHSLRPKILKTDSRTKAGKVARDRFSRDEYEEEEEEEL
ncbi:hypothetical protein BOTCAL_0187g00200 [Botryotinia calthae]|uniref:Uncharacterized protein n=1 Tax=Botryotinia calthae TaxID=38488 RepID=A0A4Y8D044_9HELO|nr:hypothetical protein BOTCAL_0187g00200 [Botryotinia calthae]